MGFFSKLMGTHSQRELKRIYPIVDKIEALDSVVSKLSDEELAERQAKWQKKVPELFPNSYLKRYAHLVTSASTGAVLREDF